MSEHQQFAYGKDTMGDCPCPAVAAGFSPASGDGSLTAAEWYDDAVYQLDLENADSILSESDAETAWSEMISSLEKRDMPESVEVAREIADELGWEA